MITDGRWADAGNYKETKHGSTVRENGIRSQAPSILDSHAEELSVVRTPIRPALHALAGRDGQQGNSGVPAATSRARRQRFQHQDVRGQLALPLCRHGGSPRGGAKHSLASRGPEAPRRDRPRPCPSPARQGRAAQVPRGRDDRLRYRAAHFRDPCTRNPRHRRQGRSHPRSTRQGRSPTPGAVAATTARSPARVLASGEAARPAPVPSVGTATSARIADASARSTTRAAIAIAPSARPCDKHVG